MAAEARAPRGKPAKPAATPGRLSRPPGRPAALPPGEPDEIIGIVVPDDDEEAPEPERVALFSIGEKVYTMLKDPPPTLGIGALETADAKGGAGWAEVYLLREMMGADALRALIDAGKRGWLKKGQYQAISRRVMAAALGVEEDDLPNP